MSETLNLSPKQWEVATLAEQPHRRFVVPGATQSGKSFAAFYGFFRFASMMFAGHDFGIAARSGHQATAVAVKYMRWFAALHGMQLRHRTTYWEMPSWIGSAPNRFHIRLASDAGATDRQFGPALAAVIFDEWPRMREDFIAALESRCSVPGAKIVYTGNPQGPAHFGKLRYVDRCESDPSFGRHLSFDVWDNPEQTQEYVDSLDETYSGADLRRMKYAEWAASSGLIWPGFERAISKPPPLSEALRFEVSADHASSGVCHALLYAQFPQGWWCIDEWRHDGRDEGQLEVDVQARRMLDAFNITRGGRTVPIFIVDPAAASFRSAIRIELRNRGLTGKVEQADNAVTEGIQLTDQWLRRRVVRISPDCRRLIGEMHNYIWDEKAGEIGDDKPVKTDDHGCDAKRYWCYTKSGKATRNVNRPRLLR
ncbi:MAG: terminase family protein [Chloroflexi bacterium]|nr:terminase family protein [Chloroflexota bacterium]